MPEIKPIPNSAAKVPASETASKPEKNFVEKYIDFVEKLDIEDTKNNPFTRMLASSLSYPKDYDNMEGFVHLSHMDKVMAYIAEQEKENPSPIDKIIQVNNLLSPAYWIYKFFSD